MEIVQQQASGTGRFSKHDLHFIEYIMFSPESSQSITFC